MNEAKQMYHDRMTALLPILPRTAYHDVRCVSNLVWALTGLCLTQTVRPACLRAMHRMQPAVCAAFPAGYIIQPSSLRSGIHPSSRQRLRDWPRNTRLYVVLKRLRLPPFLLIRASFVYRVVPSFWLGGPCVVGRTPCLTCDLIVILLVQDSQHVRWLLDAHVTWLCWFSALLLSKAWGP
jgi:hypothetical protein